MSILLESILIYIHIFIFTYLVTKCILLIIININLYYTIIHMIKSLMPLLLSHRHVKIPMEFSRTSKPFNTNDVVTEKSDCGIISVF